MLNGKINILQYNPGWVVNWVGVVTVKGLNTAGLELGLFTLTHVNAGLGLQL